MNPRWDELDLKSDSSRMRLYRRLQSWYREIQLGVPPALVKARKKDATYERFVGSYLPPDAVSQQESLNFITPEANEHAAERIARRSHERAALDPVRLRHNMLSSMPMCFNIFGALRARPELATLLDEVLDCEVAQIDKVLCEWAPRPTTHFLDDKSAFDAVVFFRDAAGGQRFCAVETKYTETFSPGVYDRPMYAEVTDAEEGWFVPASLPILKAAKTNQLWRNTMLAAAFEARGNKHGKPGRGDVLVLALSDDAGAAECVEAVKSAAQRPDATSPLHTRRSRHARRSDARPLHMGRTL